MPKACARRRCGRTATTSPSSSSSRPSSATTPPRPTRRPTYNHVEATEQAIKAALSSGYPVVVGILVFSSFEGADVAQTGNVPLPQPGEQDLGGHAVVCVGYTGDSWIMRNSWGAQWGDQGYFYLPIQYLTDPKFCLTDFWIITSVSNDPAPGPKPPISNFHKIHFPHLFGL